MCNISGQVSGSLHSKSRNIASDIIMSRFRGINNNQKARELLLSFYPHLLYNNPEYYKCFSYNI